MLSWRYVVNAGDRGASAVVLAITLFLLMGMAAVAVDLGAGVVERRADQTAADLGAVAGALEVSIGTSGGGVSQDDLVTSAIEYVRLNLPIQYGDSEWQAIWEGCVDPVSDRNSEPGDNFVAMSPPAAWGWNVTDPANWCLSLDPAKSLFRVRTPDQVVPTTFGRILGIDTLDIHAAAVAIILHGDGNILPFGFPTGASDGVQQCLSSGPTGLVDDPCTGPLSGNFGTLKIRRFTPTPYNGCNVAPLNSVLALNIAAGIDHSIVPDGDGVEVRDKCYNPLVDTVETDVGFPSGTEKGLATGSDLPAGETARLQQGPQPRQNVVGYNLDDRPLWHWLTATPASGTPTDFGGRTTSATTADDAPLFCDPAGFSGPYDFDGDLTPDSQYDFDGDGNPDPLASWQHMERCLTDYASGTVDPFGIGPATGSNFPVIFSSDLGDKDGSKWSARFAYVPQFFSSTLGPGGSWLRVKRYRAIFIQGTWWRKGTSWVVHYPGEPCSPCSGSGYSLVQVSSWIIPDGALPRELRGDPPGSGVGFISPFRIELKR